MGWDGIGWDGIMSGRLLPDQHITESHARVLWSVAASEQATGRWDSAERVETSSVSLRLLSKLTLWIMMN